MEFIQFFMKQLLRRFLPCIKSGISKTIPFLFLFLGRIFSPASALAAIRASYLSSVEGSVNCSDRASKLL